MTTWQVVGCDSNDNEFSVARNVQTKLDASLIADMFNTRDAEHGITYHVEKEL